MKLELIKGRLESLTVQRNEADFVFTNMDQAGIAGTSILAGLAGLSGAAIGLASSETKEAADEIAAVINGKRVCGWLWRCPFQEGDIVEAVVEREGDIYFLYCVQRPTDRLIALHPHCLRGTKAHKRNAIKEWRNDVIYKASALYLIYCFIDLFHSDFNLNKVASHLIFFGVLMFGIFPFLLAYLRWRLASRWMKFARLCDQIFETLGWENPKEVDLPARSKAQRKKGETWELGAFYHRY